VKWIDFLYAFVPIFASVDAPGVLPLFMGLTEGLDRKERSRIIFQALIVATVVAIGFILLGKSIFRFMGICVDDFKIAGGVLLFIIATLDLVTGTKFARRDVATIGAVPLGMPLIVGPATLTTCLMVEGVYGLGPTIVSVIANILLAGMVFLSADWWMRILREGGSRVLRKVASLVLAAIAVMMIRMGVVGLIKAATVAAAAAQ